MKLYYDQEKRSQPTHYILNQISYNKDERKKEDFKHEIINKKRKNQLLRL